MRENTGIVMDLRGQVLVQQLLKAFKTAKRFQIDEDALLEELQDIANTGLVKSLRLPGTDGLKEAAQLRFAVQGARDRVVAMNQELRSVLLAATRTYRTGLVFLRQQPQMVGMTAKATDDIVMLALVEVSECVSTVERLLVETKETLANLDDRSKVIDSWFSLHKQYVFMSLNRGPSADEDDKEPEQSARKLGRQRA
jgi:hypothetical protein